MARKESSNENAATQQKVVDEQNAVAIVAAKTTSQTETKMENKNFFSHVQQNMQQMGNEWVKLMTESATRFTANLEEMHKLEKQSVAKAMSVVDEAGRVAKEAINMTEQFSAQWRKAMTEYTQRTLDLITPKN